MYSIGIDFEVMDRVWLTYDNTCIKNIIVLMIERYETAPNIIIMKNCPYFKKITKILSDVKYDLKIAFRLKVVNNINEFVKASTDVLFLMTQHTDPNNLHNLVLYKRKFNIDHIHIIKMGVIVSDSY